MLSVRCLPASLHAPPCPSSPSFLCLFFLFFGNLQGRRSRCWRSGLAGRSALLLAAIAFARHARNRRWRLCRSLASAKLAAAPVCCLRLATPAKKLESTKFPTIPLPQWPPTTKPRRRWPCPHDGAGEEDASCPLALPFFIFSFLVEGLGPLALVFTFPFFLSVRGELPRPARALDDADGAA